MFCFVMKLFAKLILEITLKTVTFLPGTFVTLDSGPYKEGVRGTNVKKLNAFALDRMDGGRIEVLHL